LRLRTRRTTIDEDAEESDDEEGMDVDEA